MTASVVIGLSAVIVGLREGEAMVLTVGAPAAEGLPFGPFDPDGHRTFGDYGDVIIYERYGRSDQTPIIHRAMLRLEYNATSISFAATKAGPFP